MTILSKPQDFAPFIGKRFECENQHVVLQLASIDVKPPYVLGGAQRTPFLLIFHGPVGDVLPEGMFRVHIEDGPVTDIYIMPIHTVAPGRQEYQAVFN
jgi:hypothetical protein